MLRKIKKFFHGIFETEPVVKGNHLKWNEAVKRMLK